MSDKLIVLITGVNLPHPPPFPSRFPNHPPPNPNPPVQANQGIGYHAATQLAATGTYHVLLGSRSLAKGQEAVHSITTNAQRPVQSADIEALQIDVTDDGSIDQAVESVKARFGRLDIVRASSSRPRRRRPCMLTRARQPAHQQRRHIDPPLPFRDPPRAIPGDLQREPLRGRVHDISLPPAVPVLHRARREKDNLRLEFAFQSARGDQTGLGIPGEHVPRLPE